MDHIFSDSFSVSFDRATLGVHLQGLIKKHQVDPMERNQMHNHKLNVVEYDVKLLIGLSVLNEREYNINKL